MGISGWFATLFVAFLCYTSYHQSLKHPYEQIPDVPKFLVPISTGKERNLGGGNRDASMYTQSVRRKATVDGFYGSGRVMKETTHTTGFTTGVVEVFAMSDICVRTCKKAAAICAQILEGGTVSDEFCDILDGVGDIEIDGGDAYTDVCARYPVLCSNVLVGGAAPDEYCDVVDGLGDTPLEGGSSGTEVC